MINASAQVTPWELPGNTGTDPSTDFVGTTDNFELVFRTDDLFRFRLNKTETYGTLGGFTNVSANGFALISPSDNFINNAPGPYNLNLCRVSRIGSCTTASFHPYPQSIRGMLPRHEIFGTQALIPQFGPYIRSA